MPPKATLRWIPSKSSEVVLVAYVFVSSTWRDFAMTTDESNWALHHESMPGSEAQ